MCLCAVVVDIVAAEATVLAGIAEVGVGLTAVTAALSLWEASSDGGVGGR